MSIALDRPEIQPNPESHVAINETAKRVAASQTFSRSDQLRRLLLHLCKQSLAGREDQLHEQQIGVDVFGRPRDYDPGIDGIVRTHATRLRQRLELYFSQEGADDPIQIEIPRGGYVPHFYGHLPGSNESSDVSPGPVAPTEITPQELGMSEPVSQVEQEPKQRLKLLPPFLGGVLLALLAAGLFLHLRQDSILRKELSSDERTDVEHHFWSILLPTKQRTRVITGDSGLVMYETFAGREISLSDYLQGSYRGTPTSLTRSPKLTSEELAVDLANRRYTSEVDLRLSSMISRLPEWNPSRDELLFARDLRPSDANESNLILIGSRQANPWVSLIDPGMNFLLRQDETGAFYYVNKNPQRGENPRYEVQSKSSGLEAPMTYGDVAFAPNPSGKGMILSLGGLWMSGTEAAGRFVFTEKGFSEFLRSIQRPDGSIPPFEILIESHSLDGSSTQSTVVARRVKK
ncbi:hypothetical protein [Terriglobus sp. ADX1]|uniref:hypothetical protein n=1 Tax=Terriglobus sp. ADX1 TaxID=2794063 RepID=UPI002FE64A0A